VKDKRALTHERGIKAGQPKCSGGSLGGRGTGPGYKGFRGYWGKKKKEFQEKGEAHLTRHGPEE